MAEALDSHPSWADEPEPATAPPAESSSAGRGRGGRGSGRGGRGSGRGGGRGGRGSRGGRSRPLGLKPQRPDDAETRAMIQKLQETIVQKKQRGDELKSVIDAKRSGKAKASPQQAAARSRLAELRAQLQQLAAQRQGVQAQLDVASSARERTRESLKHLKTGTRFTRAENIDEQIAELEARLAGSSVNVSAELAAEERHKVERQLAALQQTRSHVEGLRASASALGKDGGVVEELGGRVKAQEGELRQKLAALQAAEAEQSGDLPALIQERDECRAICKAAYTKVQELRNDLNAEWAAYKEQSAAFHQQLLAHKQEQQAERLRRQAEQGERQQQADAAQRQQVEAGGEQQEQQQQQQQPGGGGNEEAPQMSERSSRSGHSPGRGRSGGHGSARGRGAAGRGRGRGQQTEGSPEHAPLPSCMPDGTSGADP